jgi:hypothetical protein
MKNLSRFDLAMIIAFVIVALLGGAGWWWLSGQLQSEQADASTAAETFDQYSKKEVFLPTKSNVATLRKNIDIMTRQLDPLVQNRLQSSKNALKGVHSVDTVGWKHDLDDQVAKLNAAAATHGIVVPKNFYYGFSRYLDTNPTEEATAVLKRQQIGIGALASILINAPVKEIIRVRRSAEEDAATGDSPFGQRTSSSATPPDDILPDQRSVEAPGGVYTAYPFELEFDTDTESLRTVINQIMQSDYVFVIRSVLIQNQRLDSPKVSDLDHMAGVTDQPSIIGSSPGAVAQQSAPTIGIQYLFGDETLHVRMMVDLIDWHGMSDTTGNAPAAHAPGARNGRHHNTSGAGGAPAGNPPANGV